MKTKKNLATFALLAAVMMAATFTACSSDDDDNKVNKPTLGKTVTWDIHTQGDANVPAGEKWIITDTGSEWNRTTKRIIIGDGATVTLSGVNTKTMYTAISCLGDATIILADGTTNIVEAYVDYPAINVSTEKKIGTLTIKGTGSLEARSANCSAIGCPPYDVSTGFGTKMDCGNIVIESGTITAIGGADGAGIGNCRSNKCGDITIKGGNVTAIGGEQCGTGIGSAGWEESACGNILITGGVVTATGGLSAPGIGCDYMGSCGDVTITDQVTKVTAICSSESEASIRTEGSTITIGGKVYGKWVDDNPFVYEP